MRLLANYITHLRKLGQKQKNCVPNDTFVRFSIKTQVYGTDLLNFGTNDAFFSMS